MPVYATCSKPVSELQTILLFCTTQFGHYACISRVAGQLVNCSLSSRMAATTQPPLYHVTTAAAVCSCADTRFLQTQHHETAVTSSQSCQELSDVYVQTPKEELLMPLLWEGSVILPINPDTPGTSQMQLQPEHNSQCDRCRLLGHSCCACLKTA